MTGDRIEVAVERPSKLGEGAFWDHSTGLLHWVDIDDWKFFAYDPRTGLLFAPSIESCHRAGGEWRPGCRGSS